MERPMNEYVTEIGKDTKWYKLCEFLDLVTREENALEVVRGLRDKGVDIRKYVDKRRHREGRTALHCAVDRGFVRVCAILIGIGMDPLQQDKTSNKSRPLVMAVQREHDDIAEWLIRGAKKFRVRELMTSQNNLAPEINLHKLLEAVKNEKPKMKKTIKTLMDCLYEPWIVGEYKFFYNALEADRFGKLPAFSRGNGSSAVCLMAKNKYKDYFDHEVVKALVDRKWTQYGRTHYMLKSISYLVSLFCLTFSMWSGTTAANVVMYNSPMDYVRAVFEIISFLYAFTSFVVESSQVVRFKVRYFKEDKYNLFELISSSLLVCTLPVRYTHVNVHWYLFSLGYLVWVLRIFKYITLYRWMGTYVSVLYELSIGVFPRFAILFFILTLAFGGALSLSLKGDGNPEDAIETSSFPMILLTGTLTVTAGEPMFTYSLAYGAVSSILIILFLFTIIIVLLSILIAQLNDAIPRAMKVVDRNINFKRARIVVQVESGTHRFIDIGRKLLLKTLRKQKLARQHEYVAHEIIELPEDKRQFLDSQVMHKAMTQSTHQI